MSSKSSDTLLQFFLNFHHYQILFNYCLAMSSAENSFLSIYTLCYVYALCYRTHLMSSTSTIKKPLFIWNIYRVNPILAPVTCRYFSNACKFFMLFYVVEQENIHFIAKFCSNISKNHNIMLFQPKQPHFSRFGTLSSPIVHSWLWKEPVCWWWDEETWRWTELLQMLEVATIGSHSYAGSQAVGEVCNACWRVLVTALLRWTAGRLPTHQSC